MSSKSRKPTMDTKTTTTAKLPLSKGEFNKKIIELAKNDNVKLKNAWKKRVRDMFLPLAENINKKLLQHYKHWFSFTKRDAEQYIDIITKEDVDEIKKQLGPKPKNSNLENASYQWQMLLFEVIRLMKPYLCRDFEHTGDCDCDWRVEYATFDASMIVLFNAYPTFVNAEYISYEKLDTPLF